MPPIQAIKNQYRGVNAHLHSHWQNSGGWDGFHTIHISDLTRVLQAHLRPLGYEAEAEQSLQIRHAGERSSYPKSDVTIYDPVPARQPREISSPSGNTLEVVIPIPTLLDLAEEEIEYYRAIGIYQAKSSRADRGQPVAWVELLSPSNKSVGRDFERYKEKRTQVLQSGIVFVEIDYLHQTPPTFARLPSYRPANRNQPPEPGSHPYHITVIDPRPDFYEGQGRTRQFDVDASIPTITIPLNAGDKLDFDFGEPYQKTFREMFYGDKVDYSQLPEAFDLYSADDQARIARRMLAVKRAVANGDDLDNAPFPVEEITLSMALDALREGSGGA
jgi:hypothetical protein